MTVTKSLDSKEEHPGDRQAMALSELFCCCLFEAMLDFLLKELHMAGIMIRILGGRG